MNLFDLFSSINSKSFNNNYDKSILESSSLMGVGLAFCHKMLGKMDSHLELKSTVNIGSTFSFALNMTFNSKEESVNENAP